MNALLLEFLDRTTIFSALVHTSMSVWETISAVGSLVMLLGLLAIMPDYFTLTSNFTNPNYPAFEVVSSLITAIIMLIIPTSLLGFIFMFADVMVE